MTVSPTARRRRRRGHRGHRRLPVQERRAGHPRAGAAAPPPVRAAGRPGPGGRPQRKAFRPATPPFSENNTASPPCFHCLSHVFSLPFLAAFPDAGPHRALPPAVEGGREKGVEPVPGGADGRNLRVPLEGPGSGGVCPGTGASVRWSVAQPKRWLVGGLDRVDRLFSPTLVRPPSTPLLNASGQKGGFTGAF